MVGVEIIALAVLVVVIARSRPPARRTSPRVLSLLATATLLALGVAVSAIAIVLSERVFAVAIGAAGLCGCVFLWLARGQEDDDEDGDEPPEPLPPAADGGAARFGRKRADGGRPRQPRA